MKKSMLKKIRNKDDNTRLAVLLIAPAIFVMGLIIIYPLLRALYLSFFNYQLLKPKDIAFNFLQNYQRMLHDETFLLTMKNTFVFTFSTAVVSFILGLIMAIVIDQLSQRFSGLRGILLIPWVIPGIVVGYLFMYMFDVEVGIINFLLQQINVIDKYLPWLMDHQLAMVAIIVAHVWNQAPFYMLMFTAGLVAIPEDVKEAAYVEGASRWQEFIHVTLPNLKGIMIITTLLMVIRNFNNFPIIFTMTGGGPVYATTTSVIYIWRQAFQQYDLGYASAIGVLWVIILLIVSILYINALQKDF